MEFTEENASAFARLREGKKAQVRETRRSLEKRSQQLMEQSALLKHDIDTFENELATIGIRNYLTGVAHVCACSPLCPAVWSMLPVGLLQHVFSRLPLPEIIRLRVLSKTWDKYVTGVTPGFTKLCAERNPNMFALIRKGWEDDVSERGHVIIKLYDRKEKRWHLFVHKTRVPETSVTMFAGDGGLVCRVCTARDIEMHPLNILVFNPLTRQGRQLPPSSSLSRTQPRMIQLVMDKDSKCYKVLVVHSEKESVGDVVAMIFSSVTGVWSEPNISSGLIFGCQYLWKHGPGDRYSPKADADPCAYDCGSSTLLEFDDDSYPCGFENFHDKTVLVKDHLIVLDVNEDNETFLSDYQAQEHQPHWIQRKVRRCYELDEVHVNDALETRFFGCQDFSILNVFANLEYDYIHHRTFLFDVCKSQWQTIPKIPKCGLFHPNSDMFELQWDAVP